MRLDWSPRVYELEKIFEPYWDYKKKDIVEDAPQEVRDAYEEFCNLVEEEAWL